jgi:Zn-dependent metalloprotease
MGKDPQPADMRHYIHTSEDNGGVHLNSGISNHAFYLVATAIGGNAWEKAGQIWYDTIRDKNLKPTANFAVQTYHRQCRASLRSEQHRAAGGGRRLAASRGSAQLRSARAASVARAT